MSSSQYIIILAKDWFKSKNNFLKSRNSFESQIVKTITTGIFNPDVKTVIVLPYEVTMAERHRIHTFSIKNNITSKSETKFGKRQMKIFIESEYIKRLL